MESKWKGTKRGVAHRGVDTEGKSLWLLVQVTMKLHEGAESVFVGHSMLKGKT